MTFYIFITMTCRFSRDTQQKQWLSPDNNAASTFWTPMKLETNKNDFSCCILLKRPRSLETLFGALTWKPAIILFCTLVVLATIENSVPEVVASRGSRVFEFRSPDNQPKSLVSLLCSTSCFVTLSR